MEDLNLEALKERAGSAYRLVTLFQKRMRELERGWPPMVDPAGRKLHQVVQEEFERGLIHLVSGEEADALREERSAEAAELSRRRTVREMGSRLSGPVSEPSGGAPAAPAP